MPRAWDDLGPSPFRHRQKIILPTPAQATLQKTPPALQVIGSADVQSSNNYDLESGPSNLPSLPAILLSPPDEPNDKQPSSEARAGSGSASGSPQGDMTTSTQHSMSPSNITLSSENADGSDRTTPPASTNTPRKQVKTSRKYQLCKTGKGQVSKKYRDLGDIHAEFSRPLSASENPFRRTFRPPFLQTRLGKVPPEIREIIFQYVLIAPTSQGTVILPASVPPEVESIGEPSNNVSATLPSSTGKARATASGRIAHPKPSCLSILLGCRQIYLEAAHIFYANKLFHFTNAPALRGFLEAMGPVPRNELQTLHVRGLVEQCPRYTEQELEQRCVEMGYNGNIRDAIATTTRPVQAPSATAISKLLGGCNNISKVVISFQVGEEKDYLFILAAIYGYGQTVIEITDSSHWTLMAPWDSGAVRDWWRSNPAKQAQVPGEVDGAERQVEVKFVREAELSLDALVIH